MVITRIEIIPLHIPMTHPMSISYTTFRTCDFVLTRVRTDENIEGLGECPPLPPLSRESQETIVPLLEKFLAPQLIGEDPFDLERIWEKMDSAMPGYPFPKAALDIALYDIMGRALKVPVHKLLGGGYKTRFPNVGLIGLGSTEEIQSLAQKYVRDGYKTIRLKTGLGVKADEKNVRAVRSIIGDDVELRLDANQAYIPPNAIKFVRTMERYDIELVEQPTPWYDFKGLASVAKAVDTPIMPHESLYLLSDAVQLLDLGAADVLGLKVYRPGGGITSARKLISLAQLTDVPCLMHDDVELGISLAAATHFVAANHRHLKYANELSGYPTWITDDVVKRTPRIEGGFFEVPSGPGLGVELDERKLRKYAERTIVCERK
jgi:L-alanine-DL-glutamate epimerase-like enolase superfamily enzyme